MLNTFEKAKKDKMRLANIILLKVPNSSRKNKKGTGDENEEEEPEDYVIGGYASDGWAASQELLGNGGDETCFLFNLT